MAGRRAVVLAAYLFALGTSTLEIPSPDEPRLCPNKGALPSFPHCGNNFSQPCADNLANDRLSWCQCDICTNADLFTHVTRVTRKYDFYINATTALGPDGVSRDITTVNGKVLGPTIFADWGDDIEITVHNNLIDYSTYDPITGRQQHYDERGVSIHWHGINQNYSSQNDGVPSLTQCPIPPGGNYTYRWHAAHYGTAWYHSHIETQAWNGVFGGIIINGPASSNYDEDRGVLFLNDWSHQSTEEYYGTVSSYGPQKLANGLINGTNIWNNSLQSMPGVYFLKTLDPEATTTSASATSPTETSVFSGYRFNMTTKRNRSYRLRLVNAAIDTHWEFFIEDHSLKVISVDMVPIVPYETSSLKIGMGQRYDFILETNSTNPGPFWIQAQPLEPCSGGIFNPNHTMGMLYYEGSDPAASPSRWTNATNHTGCVDEKMENLVPYIIQDVPWPWPEVTSSSEFAMLPREGNFSTRYYDATVYNFHNGTTTMEWQLNKSTMHVDWRYPTLQTARQEVMAGNMSSLSSLNNAVVLPKGTKWFYLLLTNSQTGGSPAAHPMHLHGHDFYILSQDNTTWNGTVQTHNPPRRDTAMLDVAFGHILLAWQVNNPGVWLFHCHLGWHTEMGFDLQFIEMPEDIPLMMSPAAVNKMNSNCQAWAKTPITQDHNDSGV